MERRITLVWFSATSTTKKIVQTVASEFAGEINTRDITPADSDCNEALNAESDLLIVGMPVYAGRIPASAAEKLRCLKGYGVPAIAVVAYGNREYDDALLELCDLLSENGFKVVGAGAFIAQHSIFPKVAADRPDSSDIRKISEFAKECRRKVEQDDWSIKSEIKGNRPYKTPGNIPLHPKGSRFKCKKCGACVCLCPVKAIPLEAPHTTISERCISCGQCISACPASARRYRGLLYKIAGKKFFKANSARKEPEWFV